MKHLFLIGFRGAGKSTVAQLLSDRTGLPLQRTDDLIQLKAGQSIAQIFETDGEAAFRKLESRVLKSCLSNQPSIIDLGGGAILDETNRRMILSHGEVVYLSAEVEVLWNRIKCDKNSNSTRPRLTNLDGLEEVRQVYAKRQPIYEEYSDYAIDTSRLKPQEVVEQIVGWMHQVDK